MHENRWVSHTGLAKRVHAHFPCTLFSSPEGAESDLIAVGEIIAAMEEWAPGSLCESWDNVGLMTGSPEDERDSVLITLDVMDKTIETACTLSHPLIISHHPLIFKPLRHLTGTSRAERLVCSAIRHDIAIFAAHTNLDQAPEGVSHALARRLGLENISKLTSRRGMLFKFVTFVPPAYTDRVRQAASDAGAGIIGEYRSCSFASDGTGTYKPTDAATPFSGKAGELSREPEQRLEMVVPEPFIARVVDRAKKAHPYEEMAYDIIPLAQPDPRYGYGAIGTLPSPVPRNRFPEAVCTSLGIDSILVSPGGPSTIRKVAVMGGSGESVIPEAIAQGADAFVTGEIGYHAFLEHGDALLLAAAGHHATESPVLDTIREKLSSRFASITFVIDRTTTPEMKFFSPHT